MNQPEPPLLDGGQGRSREAVEASTAAFAWCSLALLILLVIVGVTA